MKTDRNKRKHSLHWKLMKGKVIEKLKTASVLPPKLENQNLAALPLQNMNAEMSMLDKLSMVALTSTEDLNNLNSQHFSLLHEPREIKKQETENTAQESCKSTEGIASMEQQESENVSSKEIAFEETKEVHVRKRGRPKKILQDIPVNNEEVKNSESVIPTDTDIEERIPSEPSTSVNKQRGRRKFIYNTNFVDAAIESVVKHVEYEDSVVSIDVNKKVEIFELSTKHTDLNQENVLKIEEEEEELYIEEKLPQKDKKEEKSCDNNKNPAVKHKLNVLDEENCQQKETYNKKQKLNSNSVVKDNSPNILDLFADIVLKEDNSSKYCIPTNQEHPQNNSISSNLIQNNELNLNSESPACPINSNVELSSLQPLDLRVCKMSISEMTSNIIEKLIDDPIQNLTPPTNHSSNPELKIIQNNDELSPSSLPHVKPADFKDNPRLNCDQVSKSMINNESNLNKKYNKNPVQKCPLNSETITLSLILNSPLLSTTESSNLNYRNSTVNLCNSSPQSNENNEETLKFELKTTKSEVIPSVCLNEIITAKQTDMKITEENLNVLQVPRKSVLVNAKDKNTFEIMYSSIPLIVLSEDNDMRPGSDQLHTNCAVEEIIPDQESNGSSTFTADSEEDNHNYCSKLHEQYEKYNKNECNQDLEKVKSNKHSETIKFDVSSKNNLELKKMLDTPALNDNTYVYSNVSTSPADIILTPVETVDSILLNDNASNTAESVIKQNSYIKCVDVAKIKLTSKKVECEENIELSQTSNLDLP
jgi:hypothetical protein